MKSLNIFWLFILVCATSTYGQGPTGINTIKATPSQQLHVKGTIDSVRIGTSGIFTVKPTIRIDGLNLANNSATNMAYTLPSILTTSPYNASPYATWSSSLVQPVSVTQDGDLLLSRDYVIPLVATPVGGDAFSGVKKVIVPTTAGTNQNNTEVVLQTYTFTLKQTCMVHFLASMSVSVYASGSVGAGTSGTVLTDGFVKAVRSFFKFSAAPAGSGIVTGAFTTGASFGTYSGTYTNTHATGATGFMYLQPEAYLVLIPGQYTVNLWGYGFGFNYPCDVVYGGASDDMVSIIATPLN